MRQNDKTVLVAKYGMLIALACIFSYIEALVMVPLPYGIKLGLANLVSVVGLYIVGIPGTIAVSLTRILLMGLVFSSSPATLIYSLSGGTLSLILMIAAKKSRWFGRIGVSVIGGIGHNVGQVAAAAWMVRTAAIFTYLPLLLITGVVAGTLIGILGGLVIERVQKVVKKV